ncbi:hypothetical protein [Streptomyces galbus]|uniref:hypothetical protein n=1 Tax=Streptomyces galbus TaxID=33898 RepID=UPI003EBB8215
MGDEKVHLAVVFAAADGLPWAEGVRRLAHTLLVAKHLVAPLTSAARAGHRAAFVTVTRLDGSFGLSGVAEDAAPAGGVGGLVKTLAVEAPELFCRAVDLAPGSVPPRRRSWSCRRRRTRPRPRCRWAGTAAAGSPSPPPATRPPRPAPPSPPTTCSW